MPCVHGMSLRQTQVCIPAGFVPRWMVTAPVLRQVYLDVSETLGKVVPVPWFPAANSLKQWFTGVPDFKPSTVASLYKSSYADRFPCLLSALEFRAVGAVGSHGCVYNTEEWPAEDVLNHTSQALCTLLHKQSSTFTVNWSQYCGNNGSVGETFVDESWSGVYFLGEAIALHLHRVGLQGESQRVTLEATASMFSPLLVPGRVLGGQERSLRSCAISRALLTWMCRIMTSLVRNRGVQCCARHFF